MPNIAEYKNYLFVKVPDVEGWEIRGEHSKRPYQILSFYGEAEAIQLPPGSWQIIGKGDAIDWEGIVEMDEEEFPGFGVLYKIYDSPVGTSQCATRAHISGHSLLRSLGMEPGTTLILKKQS